jgi:hypothetical protein
MKLDLNARRSARAAANAEPKIVVLDGREYRLVDELPVRVMEHVSEMDLTAALKAMLENPDEWSDLAKTLTLQDVNEIVTMYGATLGESPASTASSTTTGALSGPTSNASTASTWPTAYTAPMTH